MVIKVHKKNLKSLTFFLIGLFVVLLPVYFMSKTLIKYDTVAGGDFYQLYEPEKHFTRYFYAWLGQFAQGSFNTLSPSGPFYYLESLAENLSFTKLLNFPLLFLFVLSYVAFFYSVVKISPNISKFWRMVLSIFYTYNYVTLSMITYPWGFTHHYIFYIFIPPILAGYVNLLTKDSLEIRTLLIFIIINSVAFIGYNNVAFMFALFIIEFLIGISVLIKSGNIKALGIIKRALVCVLLQLLLSLPYLYSFATVNISNIHKVNKTEVFGGSIEDWNVYTSSNFLKSSIMYPISGSELPLISVYIILPFLLLIYAYNNKRVKNEYLIQILLILFLILFSTKYNNPLKSVFRFSFNLPLTAMLRSPDKMFIFLPFFYAALISRILVTTRTKIIRILVGILILMSLSFFYSGFAVKYLTSVNKGYRYAINIPDEYKDFSQEVNSAEISTSILSIPYSVKNSINWSNYPKWNFVGHDVLHLLFNRNFISANVFDHPVYETNMTFRNLWKNPNCCGDDYIEKSFDRFGVEYVIWHKDIDEGRFKENIPVYEMLQKSVNNGLIQKIEDNEYFEAYQVDESKIQPLISTEKGQVTFKKINPTKYIVDIKGLKLGDRLVFKQSFNPEWKMYTSIESIGSCNERHQYISRNTLECISYNDDFVFSDVSYIFKKPLSMEHEMVDEYANSWVFDERAISTLRNVGDVIVNEDGSVDVSLVIYFRSQSLLIIQYALLVFSIVVSSTSLILISRKKHKELII